MNRDTKMMFSPECDAHALRRICRDTSEANPKYLVTGFFVFGRFPHVEYSAAISVDQVSDNAFSGYWRAGVFQVFTPAELALLDIDDDADDLPLPAAGAVVHLDTIA